MRAVCKSCNSVIELKEKGTTICENCKAEYKYSKSGNIFDIKLLNGLFLNGLSFNDIKEGIIKGKFLSVDFISYENTPWIKLKDSMFHTFFKESVPKAGGREGFWKTLFFISLILNLGMLAVLYFFKMKFLG